MNDLTITSTTELTTRNFSAELLSRFVSFLDVSAKSTDTYYKAVKQFFSYISAEGIERPQREDILSYREHLKETCKPTTVQSYITALKIFFRWTAQENLYPNVADHVKGAKLNRDHKKDYLTPSQIKEILEAMEKKSVQGKRNFAIVFLMLNGGLRDIEVSRANIEDLATIGGQTVLYVQGKGREERTDFVIVDPIVEKALRTYLKTRQTKEGTDPLFTSTSNRNANGRLTTRSISGIVKEAMRNCGYDSERLTAHSLRHTAVTLALMEGMTLQEAQQFARHSNIATTQIYAHNLDRINNKCGAKVIQAIYG